MYVDDEGKDRRKTVETEKEIGFNEYLNKANAIVLIEWYEKIASVLKGEFVKITINKIDENSREFIFEKVTL